MSENDLTLKTTAPERSGWREVYTSEFADGEMTAMIDAGRILRLLDDLDTALAALAEAEELALTYKSLLVGMGVQVKDGD